jgi:hypothetical protein
MSTVLGVHRNVLAVDVNYRRLSHGGLLFGVGEITRLRLLVGSLVMRVLVGLDQLPDQVTRLVRSARVDHVVALISLDRERAVHDREKATVKIAMGHGVFLSSSRSN